MKKSNQIDLTTIFSVYEGSSKFFRDFLARQHKVTRKGLTAVTDIYFVTSPLTAFYAFKPETQIEIGISNLLSRAQEAVLRGFISSLYDDHTTLNSISRELIEIEVLVENFAFSKEDYERWILEDDLSHSKYFNYSSVDGRVKKYLKIDPGHARPGYSEWMFHSEFQHPRFSRTPFPMSFEMMMVELASHTYSLLMAFAWHSQANDWNEVDLSKIQELITDLEIPIQQLKSQQEEMNSVLAESGYKLPDREIYRICNAPTGLKLSASTE